MPDCYLLIESNPKPPQAVFADVVECAKHCGEGKPHKEHVGKKVVQVYVYYETEEEAEKQLPCLVDCLEGKDDHVIDSRVVKTFEEAGLVGPTPTA